MKYRPRIIIKNTFTKKLKISIVYISKSNLFLRIKNVVDKGLPQKVEIKTILPNAPPPQASMYSHIPLFIKS